MDYMLVTLVAGQRNVDLKIPIFVTCGELISMLSEALNIQVKSDARIQAEPLGRILDNTRTIEDEGVTQGSILTFI